MAFKLTNEIANQNSALVLGQRTLSATFCATERLPTPCRSCALVHFIMDFRHICGRTGIKLRIVCRVINFYIGKILLTLK
jgi:hypothetical protein